MPYLKPNTGPTLEGWGGDWLYPLDPVRPTPIAPSPDDVPPADLDQEDLDWAEKEIKKVAKRHKEPAGSPNARPITVSASITIRMREFLETEAKKNGITLNREINNRLEATFGMGSDELLFARDRALLDAYNAKAMKALDSE